MTLDRRVALVTGASAGIGLAIAEHLAQAGARVVVNARRAERLGELVARLGLDRAAAAPGDAADPAALTAALDLARSRFGAEADLVVINAGRGLAGSPVTSDPAQWEQMLRTNVLGVAHLIRQSAQRMLAMAPAPAGPEGPWRSAPRDIVVIGSVVGRHVSPFSSMYGSTKFAVHGLVEGARRELAPSGVRVTLIEPGFVVSEFQGVAGYKDDWFRSILQRIGPVLEPADVARAVVFATAQPAHVHVGDVLLRPVRQDYP